MKKLMKSSLWKGLTAALVLLGLCMLVIPAPVFAGGMPQTELRYPHGAGNAQAHHGDYITAPSLTGRGGLNTYHQYFIEVPPGTGNLTVELFDAIVGGASPWDQMIGAAWNTTARYSLIAPDGTTTYYDCTSTADSICVADAWGTFATVSNPAAGHWEVRIDMSAAVTTGDDENAYAVRARDTVTGYELNMYTDSFDVPGIYSTTANGLTSVTERLYPYVTSGCSFTSNNFDFDAQYYRGSLTLASRSGGYSQTISYTNLSHNNVWSSDTISGWLSAYAASDYGIWSAAINLLSGDNTITYYIGNYDAALASVTPPTSQPQANTFRMYLPTTAGAAPVKPYVAQTVGLVSTETNGDKIIRIQVDVVNPTAFPITFSSSNLVSVYVPLSTYLTYEGNEWSTLGTTPSYNSGTQWVTWNPGTVAAGITASMTYELRLLNGASSGLALTGTPGSNGTTATFVDETGASQARATYTFGQLCGLTNNNLPTMVTLSSFDSYVSDGKVVVEWSTSLEINTVGFYLNRLDGGTGKYVSVTDRMLPTTFDSHSSGLYRLVDGGASAGAQNTYMLVEKEANGKTRNYGPFVVTPGARSGAASMPTNFSRHSIHNTVLKGLSKAARFAATKGARHAAGSSVRIAVTEDGVYSISAATIGSLLGITTTETARLIKDKSLTLSNNGATVAYMSDTANSRILFYGQAITSNYTNENIYWLTKGKGSVMSATGSGAAPSTAPGYFSFTKHFEQNLIAGTSLVSNPDDDYWYWDYILAGDSDTGTKTFDLQINGRSTEGSAALKIKLQGSYEDVAQQARFYLNEQYIGEARWNGLESKTATMSFSAGLLNEGSNSLKITGLGDSLFMFNSADLTYTRAYKAEGDSLSFTAGQAAVTVTGFSGSSVRVFDITDPVNPRSVNIRTKNNSVGFMPAAAGGKYIAVSNSAIKSVAGATAYSGSSKLKKGSAKYVVITTDELKSAASKLASFRAGKGYSTMVVTVDEIMNEFNYGIYSPVAIKNFLTYAYKKWSKKPQYVLLAGSGTYDYKDYLEKGGLHVPPAMVATEDGLAPSDNYYVNISSEHIPDIAIGRLPASTSDELSGMVSKIISYERGSGTALVNKALLVADIPDSGGDFGKDIDSVAAVFPATFTVGKLYHSEYTDATAMNSVLLQGINSGKVFVSYFGHGGADRLSQDGIMLTSDAAAMTNLARLPVMTVMSCVVGNFAIPGYTSLGEALILNKSGGVAALWAATGMSDDKKALLLDKAFFSAAFDGSARTVGELAVTAMKNANIGADYQYMLDTFVILGDPALSIKGLNKKR
jgi:hypothetical protein